jgi:hypothetical protein
MAFRRFPEQTLQSLTTTLTTHPKASCWYHVSEAIMQQALEWWEDHDGNLPLTKILQTVHHEVANYATSKNVKLPSTPPEEHSLQKHIRVWRTREALIDFGMSVDDLPGFEVCRVLYKLRDNPDKLTEIFIACGGPQAATVKAVNAAIGNLADA